MQRKCEGAGVFAYTSDCPRLSGIEPAARRAATQTRDGEDLSSDQLAGTRRVRPCQAHQVRQQAFACHLAHADRL